MAIRTKTILSFFLLVIAALLGGCAGVMHKVGDSEGWAPGVDYYTWVTSRHFEVGDSLVFEYDKSLDDVTQVVHPLAFEFCKSAFAIARYKTGHDVIHLTQPGRYYFFSAVPGHCAAKQMFDILVVKPFPPSHLAAHATQSHNSSSPSSSSAPSPVANAPHGMLPSPLHNAAPSSSSSRTGSSFLALLLFVGLVV